MKLSELRPDELVNEIKKLKSELNKSELIIKFLRDQVKSSNKNQTGELHDLYKLIFNKMLNGFALLDIIYNSKKEPVDFRVAEVNESFEKITGTKSEKIIGLSFTSFMPAAEGYWTQTFREAVLSGTVRHFENYSPDLKKYLEVIAFLPQKEKLAVVFADVTERKSAVEKIIGLNRIYSVLSNINQTIVRVRDKQKLFESVCNIAVKYGLFKFVWIGINDSASQKIAPIKWKEAEDNRSIADALVLNQEIFNCSPTQIKDGTFICNDIRSSNFDQRWKENSLRLGLNSCGSFPIKIDDKIIGSINFYSKDKNVFNILEIDLLLELSLDLGFAIEFIEHEEQKKEAEKLLSLSEERYRSLYQNAPVGIYRTTYDGRFIFANPAFVKLVKYDSFEELALREAKEFYKKPEARERFTSLLEKEEIIFGYESEIVAKDGTIIYIRENVRSFKDSNGSAVVYEGFVEDITETKLAKLELRYSEIKYKELTELLPQTIFEVDANGKLTFTNKSGMQAFKITEEDFFRGINVIDFISSEDKERAFSDIKKVLSGEKRSTGTEYNAIRKDGSVFPVIIYSNCIHRKDKVVGLRGFIIDITERKIAERQLINAKQKAEEMNKLKSSFLANMSHELRTPLIGILGFAEILSKEIAQMELNEMANIIHTSGNRLLETLNLVLDFSRIESNNYDMKIVPVKIIKPLTEAVKFFWNFAAKRNLYLKIETQDDSITAKIDEGLFIQVLNNLLNNAIKFTNVGGVLISFDKEKIDGEGWAVIKIKDTGIGIPEGSLQIIFEEFRQVSEGINRNYEGTGLGLTITKRFVELMNGKISVESVYGKGSTFILHLPLAEDENAGRCLNIIKDNTPVLPKILVVENEKISYELIRLTLKKLCDIDWVESGASAIEFAKRQKYSAIIMDIGLGYGMTGLEATGEIRKIPGYENIPIVALTAFAMYGDKEKFLEEGCTHYLSKPFTKDELTFLVKDMLGIS